MQGDRPTPATCLSRSLAASVSAKPRCTAILPVCRCDTEFPGSEGGIQPRDVALHENAHGPCPASPSTARTSLRGSPKRLSKGGRQRGGNANARGGFGSANFCGRDKESTSSKFA